MSKAHLIPGTGLIVRDPQSGVPLPPEGEEKTLDSYWIRRLQDGDVTIKHAAVAEVPPRATPVKTKPIAKE